MKSFYKRLLQFMSFRVIGRKTTKRFLLKLFRAFDLDILQVAHSDMGINNYGNSYDTGEVYFLEKFLLEKYKDQSINIIDVGANVGNYSLLLNKIFPLAKIYAFEPNPITYKSLENKTFSINNIYSFCIGLGSTPSKMEIYTYTNDKSSEHASIIKDVMVTLHNSEAVSGYQVDITSLDDFCITQSIKKIHFLKIDTEGYELEVLKGAVNLIDRNSIEIIQFEFNEMNIFSRVFLRDFYSLLPNYRFFRLSIEKLIPLDEYNPSNEIFKYQNIIAIRQLY